MTISAAALVSDELKARDKDRWLACLYAPEAARPGLMALFALDLELAQVVATTTDPMLGEIRLAWWRERLTELDAGRAPAQPLLEALLAHALPVLKGAELAGLEDRWLGLIGSDAVPPAHVEGGGLLFALAARLLGGDAAAGDALGRAWALGEAPAGRTPARLRLLRALVQLAARDAARVRKGALREARGSLPRQWILLKSVAFGR
jgi:15-cis-phytoene synthase